LEKKEDEPFSSNKQSSVKRNRPVRIVNSFFLLAYPGFFYEKIVSFPDNVLNHEIFLFYVKKDQIMSPKLKELAKICIYFIFKGIYE